MLVLALNGVPEFAYFVLEAAPLILVLEGDFPEFAIEHALPLALHDHPEVLELLGPAPFCGAEPHPPVFDFCLEVLVPVPLEVVLVAEGEVDALELPLELLELAVELLADEVHLLVLLQVLLAAALVAVDAVGELPDLHLVVLAVEVQLLDVPQLHAVGLHLLGQALDLDRLEHHDEVQLAHQVRLRVARQVLYLRARQVLEPRSHLRCERRADHALLHRRRVLASPVRR